MGVVKKGSFYSTLLIGVGVILGFFISGLLLPNFLTEEQNGVLSLLNSYSLIYSQIVILGIHTAVIKFFPHFKNDANRHHGFLTVISLVLFISFLFFLIYYFVTQFYFLQLFNKSPLLKQNYFYIVPLTFFTLYFTLFDNYSAANLKPVRGFFYRDVLQRILVLIALGVYILYQLSFSVFLFLYVVALCLPTVLFAGWLIKEKQFSLSIQMNELYKKNWRYMAKVSAYSLFLGIAWVGVNNIDSIMVERLINLKSAGIYSRNMFFGILVSIPYRALHKAASGVIAQAFKEGELNKIKDVYYKSTLTQLMIGAFIFWGIWLNIHNVYQIIPASYEQGKYVIFFIALGNFFTMVGGVNTAIINFSPYYKWNAYFVAVLLVLVIGLNFVFIPTLGLTGAAAATSFSYLIYNFLMWWLLLKKYQFQPFNSHHLIALIIAIVAYFIASLIPQQTFYIQDILIRSTVFTIIYGLLIYQLKLSPDINLLINQLLQKIPLLKN